MYKNLLIKNELNIKPFQYCVNQRDMPVLNFNCDDSICRHPTISSYGTVGENIFITLTDDDDQLCTEIVLYHNKMKQPKPFLAYEKSQCSLFLLDTDDVWPVTSY